MLTILLHSSKTMRNAPLANDEGTTSITPAFITEASAIMRYLATKTDDELQTCMHVSPKQMVTVRHMITQWDTDPQAGSAAIDTFIGDIYSGFQAAGLSATDRQFAQQHLIILSGLYGGLRPLDAIQPYRLEMGYRLPDEPYRNLYAFWHSKIAGLIPPGDTIINVSSAEYTKAVLPHLANRIITPKFLTVSPKTQQPAFVAVHAKIARGAFARWCIVERINNPERLHEFNELGYTYQPDVSTADEPVFICKEFRGLGMSIRLR